MTTVTIPSRVTVICAGANSKNCSESRTPLCPAGAWYKIVSIEPGENPRSALPMAHNAGSAESTKKRKNASSAVKMAVEISKIIFNHAGHEMQRKMLVEKDRVIFTELVSSQKCTWRGDKMNPLYCKNAELKFEAYLPDRKYLVRFSARCPTCYDKDVTAVHLYCGYCNEVLTGSIAGPGGKISDHLITIRHVYQQAVLINTILENGASYGTPRQQEVVSVAREYISKLEEWSDTIRYRTGGAIKRIHFEEVLERLNACLERLTALSHPVRCVPIPN